MEISLLRSLVWLDFRLAVVFTVLIPLSFLFWTVRAKNQPILRSLIIYWRVSCLLAITVYLLMADQAIGFMTGWLARILIPLSLWFWQDLNEDINRSKSRLALIYTSWRWAMAAYCGAGTLFGLNFLACTFISSDRCLVLREVPLQFKDMFHSGVPTETLAFWAIVALLVYGVCFFTFLLFSLPKQGRIAFRD